MADIVCDYLRNRIKKILTDSGESIRWLSRKCGVDYSIIYRLQSGDQQTLSFTNAVKIMKQIEPESYLSVLSDYYPFETRALSKASTEKAEELLSILAADPYLYRVFTFVAEKNFTRADIQKKFGDDGLLQLDKLLRHEILSDDGSGGMVDNLKGMSYPGEDTAKRIAAHSYHLTSLSTPATILEHFRGAVDAEGNRDIYEAGKEYREKIHGILDKRKGDIVVSGSLISGPME